MLVAAGKPWELKRMDVELQVRRGYTWCRVPRSPALPRVELMTRMIISVEESMA